MRRGSLRFKRLALHLAQRYLSRTASPYSIRQVTGNDLAGLSNLIRQPMNQESLFTNIGIARTRDVHIPYQTIEATPGIEPGYGALQAHA